MFTAGDRVVVIVPGKFFQMHGTVQRDYNSHVRVALDEGRIASWSFDNREVVHEAEWFARAADEMEW